MPIGDESPANIVAGGNQVVIPGSSQGIWHVANSDLSTVVSGSELLRPASVDDSTVKPVPIPAGVSRFLIRLRYPVATTTFTTQPIIRLVGTDVNGVPLRLDATDSTATGITFSASATALRDASFYYSPPYDRTGFDLLGCRTLYVLPSTAAAFTDGSTAQAVAAMVLFLSP